ncbi:MAG: DUF4349 domain-containing protein [Thermodesulfobacteriota bacterium]
MNRKLIILGLIGLLLISSCSSKEDSREAQRFAKAPGYFEVKKDKLDAGPDAKSRRYIAVRHHLVVETTETELPKAWESVNEFCQSIDCDIVGSSISKKTQDTPPSGNLLVRVIPKDLKPLLEHIGKVGNIVTHMTQSEDKTNIVIDVEAKIKNLTELRNRLRTMLATRTGSLKDVVEVERELSRVQSELDSLVTSRKVLANETDKVAVEIDFRSRQSITETGVFAPIASAWHEAGRVFASSIGMVITFIVAIVPWLLLIVPGLWIASKLFRKLFRKRTP